MVLTSGRLFSATFDSFLGWAVEGKLRRRVLEAFFYLLDVFGGGKVLGQGAANAFDRFADFAADLVAISLRPAGKVIAWLWHF